MESAVRPFQYVIEEYPGARPDEPSSRAYSFLLACCRQTLTPLALSELRTAGMELDGSGWHAVVSMALSHGMAPLVFTHVAHAELLPSMPEETARRLKESYIQTLVTNRRMQKELVRLTIACAERGVEVVALKGVTLAARYYGDLALRPANDIDLLVRRRDVAQTAEILKTMGYCAQPGLGRETQFYALASAALSYDQPNGPTVEVHWELTSLTLYRAGLSVERAWPRLCSVMLGDTPMRCLDSKDELSYLCVHSAAQHDHSRLIWSVDIAELVRGLPVDWDWSGFVRETIAACLATPVAAALAYCNNTIGMPLPPSVLDALQRASRAPEEQAAWRASRARLLDADWIPAHRKALRGPVDWLVFLRGVLVPGSSTVAHLYGPAAASLPQRLITYMRHARRCAPRLFTR
jgi:hypothetical protein